MNSNALKVVLLLFLGACAQNSYTPEYFQRQAQISDLAQQGMYYYWNGGDYKKAEQEFFKGIPSRVIWKLLKNSSSRPLNWIPRDWTCSIV